MDGSLTIMCLIALASGGYAVHQWATWRPMLMSAPPRPVPKPVPVMISPEPEEVNPYDHLFEVHTVDDSNTKD